MTYRFDGPGQGSSPRLGAGLLVFAPLVLIGNEIGSALRYPDLGAAVVFVPYATLTAALVVSRRADWIWYIAVGSLAHLVTHWAHWPLSWVLLAEAANIVRAMCAAVLLNAFLGSPPRLDSIRALGLFVVSAVLIAPALGAAIGALNAVVHNTSPTYWSTWSEWFASNALTGLTALPAYIVGFAYVVGARRFRLDRRAGIEGLLLLVGLWATCWIVLLGGQGGQHVALPLYGSLPVLIWAALRFGVTGASAALTWVAFALIWSVDQGLGPFLDASPSANLLSLQIYVLLTAVPVLCLATIASAKHAVVQLHGALLASLHDHVAILDGNGVVIEVNDSWRRFATLSATDAMSGARPGDRYLDACQSAANRGNATAAGVLAGLTSVLKQSQRRTEIAYDHKVDGRMESYIMSVEWLERPAGGAVVTRTNVTARRQAHIEIEEQRRQLSHLARVGMLGQLSGAFAHELNQPLTAILSNAEAARMLLHQPIDVGYFDDILRDIIADDQRAAAVIQRLRALLKQGAHRLQPIETRALITEVLELAHSELIARHIVATSSVDPALPPFAGDKVQLEQVLLNLVLNACESMSSTSTINRELIVTADAEGPASVHFAIRDTGSGIAPDLIDRLFEPFVTTKNDGLGLGLSISRSIVSAHGGRMWGENNSGVGATMHCVLPLTQIPQSDALEQAPDLAMPRRL